MNVLRQLILEVIEEVISEDKCFAFEVPIENLARSEGNFDKYKNSPKVKEIIEDIKAGKKLRPLSVMPITKKDQVDYKNKINDNSKWLVYNGHNRLTAYEILGIKTIPVRIEFWDKKMGERAEKFLQQQNINYKTVIFNKEKETSWDLQWGHLREAYYHGTTVDLQPGELLLPPSETGKISEKGRKKHLDKVFFTKDLNSAKIYAGRSGYSLGDIPVVYEVEPIGEIQPIQMKPGTTVLMAPRAKIIKKIPMA